MRSTEYYQGARELAVARDDEDLAVNAITAERAAKKLLTSLGEVGNSFRALADEIDQVAASSQGEEDETAVSMMSDVLCIVQQTMSNLGLDALLRRAAEVDRLVCAIQNTQ